MTATQSMRYVPPTAVSLSSDAPGWSSGSTDSKGRGPICWKCKGERELQVLKKNTPSNVRTCPVCKGDGFLPMKSKLLQNSNAGGAGVITSRRRRPRGWREFGHVPASIQALQHYDTLTAAEKTITQHALSILHQANGNDDDYDSKRNDVPAVIPKELLQQHPNLGPPWLPINPGEQLCNLVGRWRILQRVGSHRWTTDDLVTAYVAATTFLSSSKIVQQESSSRRNIRYLDLGTGNASVLQMTLWYLLSSDQLQKSPYQLKAFGVEARTEAVGLARRSLSFNLGSIEVKGKTYTGIENDDVNVEIVNGDFRNLSSNDELSESMQKVASEQYDLITGTPPYFFVDFSGTDGNKQTISKAVINQGGMPTSMQSAPARCEFRGGIEAYCKAAAAVLQPDGVFVVCENWLNDKRAYEGAKMSGLHVDYVWPVKGRVGKPEPLFAVYVMRKKNSEANLNSADDCQDEVTRVRDPLIVRDEDGKWTAAYAEQVLGAMSIPVV